jgi:putative ABC transport system substrate-binding protein
LALGAGEQFAGKWVELLKEVVPRASRVAALSDPQGGPQVVSLVRATEVAAQAAGLSFHVLRANRAVELEGAFATMTRAGASGLIVLPSVHFSAERKRIVELAARHRMPTMYEHREFVDAGGLLSYGPNLLALVRRAAYYVDRILKGSRPRDLPVEQPTTFELMINLKTAKALGLTIPPSLLVRADQVIE